LIKLQVDYPDPFRQLFIVAALGCIGPDAKDAVPVLLRALTNQSDVVRINATAALGKIQADPSHVLPALMLRLGDSNALVRENAILAIKRFGREAKQAVPALFQLLHDEKYDPATAPPAKHGSGGCSTVETSPSGAKGSLSTLGARADLVGAAARTLWAIDPDAATKAHLKRPE
jgi:HEAT repeat protein